MSKDCNSLPAISAGYNYKVSHWADVHTGWIQVAPADPRRWYLAFTSNGESTAIINTYIPDDESTKVGYPLGQLAMIEFDFRKHGPLVGAAWYSNVLGSGNLTTIEVWPTG